MVPIGLQLYTLRHQFGADPLACLSRIKQTGYGAVEFAAPIDADFAAYGSHMRKIGLACPSVHAGLADMAARPDAVLRMADHLGCAFIVMPYVQPNDRDWSEVLKILIAFATRATKEGYCVAYHHHDFEFEGEPGARPFDLLLRETDPSLVNFELDLYWLKKAGETPEAVISKLNGRVKLIHLKDYAADGSIADVGAGTLDITALVRAAREAGAEHYFVEHDSPAPPFWPSVEASLTYLRGFWAGI